MSAVHAFPITTDAIRETATIDAKLYAINPRVKLAVVGGQAVTKGLTRQWSAFLEGAREVRVCESLEEAREWLRT